LLKLGKDAGFYGLLHSQAKVAESAAQAFLTLVRDLPNIQSHARTMSDIEHQGDNLTHELQNLIASTFITPWDKEDLRDLSQTLDDITDSIEAVAARAVLYRITVARADLEPMAAHLVKIASKVVEAVGEVQNGLQKSASYKQRLTEIHTLENESDGLFRNALAHLFDEPGVDPLTVIKWKEIFDRVEVAVDKCEDIAKILESVMVKYA